MATIGNIFIQIDPILDVVKPDAFLVLGDTNSCLCAIGRSGACPYFIWKRVIVALSEVPGKQTAR